MKEQLVSDVKEYIIKSLRDKYGTYAGYDHRGNIEIINDESEKRIVISIRQESDIS